MESILSALFNGDIAPRATYRPALKEHLAAEKRKNQKYNWIRNRLEELDPSLKKTFDCLMDDQYAEVFWDSEQRFIDGFCLGMKMIIEVYTAKSPILGD